MPTSDNITEKTVEKKVVDEEKKAAQKPKSDKRDEQKAAPVAGEDKSTEMKGGNAKASVSDVTDSAEADAADESTCAYCNKPFKGPKGVAIHQAKNASCKLAKEQATGKKDASAVAEKKEAEEKEAEKAAQKPSSEKKLKKTDNKAPTEGDVEEGHCVYCKKVFENAKGLKLHMSKSEFCKSKAAAQW